MIFLLGYKEKEKTKNLPTWSRSMSVHADKTFAEVLRVTAALNQHSLEQKENIEKSLWMRFLFEANKGHKKHKRWSTKFMAEIHRLGWRRSLSWAGYETF